MAPIGNACLVFLVLVSVLLTSVTTTSRDLSIKQGQGLAARLESSGDSLMGALERASGAQIVYQ
ncbi:hypothetical protein SLEP1_g8553 [Rubroshorea leprosula]|uniref:Uncharacterized protein n=1 Tax=Rubroshorea leprosula TaxID=152421 RepID=A0AAV5IB51_9ROSI|nr:hypothetical protein SLEP1_g8553 [Rubroshorea leprosula]